MWPTALLDDLEKQKISYPRGIRNLAPELVEDRRGAYDSDVPGASNIKVDSR
jgi:hypothetical protein